MIVHHKFPILLTVNIAKLACSQSVFQRTASVSSFNAICMSEMAQRGNGSKSSFGSNSTHKLIIS